MAKAKKPNEGTKCPISRKDFNENAKPIAVSIDGQIKAAGLKTFSSNSFGWHLSDKVAIVVNGVPVKCQASVLITVVGSKEAI